MPKSSNDPPSRTLSAKSRSFTLDPAEPPTVRSIVFPARHRNSGDNLADHPAFHVGQSKVAAGVSVGELFVVESQCRQNGGVQVCDLNEVLDGFVSVVITATVSDSRLDAAPSHPQCECVGVVIATVLTLGVRRATKLASPHHQRVLQQIALLKISQQRSDRLIDFIAALLKLRIEIEVMIPVAVSNFDEPHSRFHHAAGEQPLAAHVVATLGTNAVQLASGLRFA